MEAVREAKRRDGSIVNKLGNRVLGVAAAFLWMLQAVATSAQPGTATIHGVVISDESGNPISDVNLALINVASGEKQQAARVMRMVAISSRVWRPVATSCGRRASVLTC